ncbi:hypothetical protein FQN60_014969 [Etheostoma spectabile]|uniref:Uncharacterized protein n=1 Tax=Etheostoma spectabile TaxID=54343 RepID=A0A5J5CWP9_9PERO|nr:hypothetical protein FQN60_014969 [Etheostoma spectabile]
MPKNARVTLCNGPYESNGVVEHRNFRLQGLQVEVKHCPSNMSAAALTARGHQCVLEDTREWNMVKLVVNGEVVFRCNIKHLEFGGDGQVDPVCKEAVNAVENAY